MKNRRWVLLLLLILTACNLPSTTASPTALAGPEPIDTRPPTLAPTYTPQPTPTLKIVYQSAFGIDYNNPEGYLSPGEQTLISSPEVLDPLRSNELSLSHLQRIYHWLKREFEPYSAGGRTIGVVTVDQLLEERRLGGCNDHGLIFAAVVRELGYPAVMIFTNSIAWMELYQAGEAEQYIGHVFVEVYVDNRWVLIDSTNGWFVAEGYDPANPVLPLQGPIAGSSEEIYGFYVTNKGVDQWDVGVHGRDDRYVLMEEVANQIVLESLVYPAYTIETFRRQ